MQYILTEAEYNNIRVDREEFERRVRLEVENRLKVIGRNTGKVLTEFFNTYLKGNSFNFYGSTVFDWHTLKRLSDQLREANELPKESCDKDTGSVIQ